MSVASRFALLLLAGLPSLLAQTLSAPTSATVYTDSQRCAECHREIAASYARTGMAQSFYIPASVNKSNDYSGSPEYYHALSDSHYSMTVRDGHYFQRRWQLAANGKEINVEELPVDYVMGSGNHARSYLHRTERGMLIELPLGWYPDKGGEWGMAPGSDTAHPQTRRFVSYKCMFCHNGYPNIPAANQAPGSDPVFAGALPEGIDCQRCHGPGAEHVRTSGRAAIVNPAKLSPEQRMEVCMQCHLETTSGRIPAVLQAFDRGTFSYIPGQPLADFAISFDHAPGTGHDGKFEAVSSVYRLRQSRCFRESAGKLECATCHDPHNIPRGEEALRKYSSVCLQCHTSGHPAGVAATAADCITCHMPKRRVDDAPHVIMTDHLIQRHAPTNALAEFPERPAEEYRGPVVPYYPAPLANTPRNDLYRAVAQVGLGNNVAVGLPVLARLVEQVKPREPEFYMVLGVGWKMADNLQEAAKAYRQALHIAPDSTRAMRALAAVDAEHAEQILAQAVEMAPNDAESWFRYGVLTSSAERIQKAIDLDPWLPDQSRRLAELTHSEAALKDALRTDPFDDAAWDLGGRILGEKGKLADAFFDFERAVKLIPSGRYLYDYALALVRADRFDEAQARAEMSVQADGTLADSHELLGGLYARKKQLADAAREYTAALALSRGSLTPNTGSPTLSAGSPTVNAGSPAPNSGSPSLNAGSPMLNAGSPSLNSGSPSLNAGSPPLNAGAPTLNAGSPTVNARTPALNTGSPPLNAGSLTLNAGSPALNAGSPTLSAGSARLELRLGTVLAAMGDKAGAAPHLREAAKASDAAIARQAEQALRELGIR